MQGPQGRGIVGATPSNINAAARHLTANRPTTKTQRHNLTITNRTKLRIILSSKVHQFRASAQASVDQSSMRSKSPDICSSCRKLGMGMAVGLIAQIQASAPAPYCGRHFGEFHEPHRPGRWSRLLGHFPNPRDGEYRSRKANPCLISIL